MNIILYICNMLHKRKDNKFIINDGNYVLIDKQSILKQKT